MNVYGSISRRMIEAGAAFLVAFVTTQAAAADPPLVMQGYDPVAYFTEGKPTKGSDRYFHDWDEGRYHFVNAAHRDLFAANPDRFAPRFGGHCTASMTRGDVNPGDPNYWAIVDGKLYLVGTGKGAEVAMKGVNRLKADPAMIATAQRNWSKGR